MLVSVRDGQIVGEDFYSGCQCGKFGGNKTERRNKNLGRDVKAGSDLVLEFLLSICGPLFSVVQPFSIPVSLGRSEGRVFWQKPQIPCTQNTAASSHCPCRIQKRGVLGACCAAQEYLSCLLEFVWYDPFS